MAIRNNEDRTGERKITAAQAPPIAADPDAAPTKTLDFTCPTEFVDLPSRGRFYPEGHPLHGEDSLEIRFMTAKDEDILTSKSLLKKGIAIDRFLQNIIVNKKVNVADLTVGDKNALVVAARITGYGADYETKVSCPLCSHAQQFSFDLNESKVSEGGLEALKESGHEAHAEATETDHGTWTVVAPKTQAVVELKLMTGANEKHMMKAQALKKKQKLPESLLTDQLRQIIVSVNGDASTATISKFINVMPALDSRFVRGAYEKLMPNLDLTQHFECHACGYEQEMEVPFTTDFFWPKR